MVENTGRTAEEIAAGPLASVQSDLARGGMIQSQSYGHVHEQGQGADMERARGAIDPSILNGLSGVSRGGNADRVVGPSTARIVGEQATGRGGHSF